MCGKTRLSRVMGSLHLLATTIVFLTREPIRKVCFDMSKEKWSDINRIVWIWLA